MSKAHKSFGKAARDLVDARMWFELDSGYGQEFLFYEELFFNTSLTKEKIDDIADHPEKILQHHRDSCYLAVNAMRNNYLFDSEKIEKVESFIEKLTPDKDIAPPSSKKTIENLFKGSIGAVVTSQFFLHENCQKHNRKQKLEESMKIGKPDIPKDTSLNM